MKSIRARTGFSELISGTLNMRVSEAHHNIRPDHLLTAEENTDRREDVTFERCRLWCNDIGIRALFIRTSTEAYSENKVLEFMAERQLQELFYVTNGSEIQIEFFHTEAEAQSKTNNSEIHKTN